MVTLALLAWHVRESVAIGPNYLAYMNQLAGGPSRGYTHLADSSLDWGQDLPALRQWLDRQGLQQPGAAPVYLSYFGTARPRYLRDRGHFPGRVHRSPPAAATRPADRRRLLRQRHGAGRRQPAVLPAGVRAELPGGVQEPGELRQGGRRSSRPWRPSCSERATRYWQDLFVQDDRLRTGRLIAYLRRRQPDAMVGYSILIYRLTDAELNEALNGPVPPA